jgi:hypothetical protein
MACSIMENPALMPPELRPRELGEREKFAAAIGYKTDTEYTGYADDDMPWR